MADAADLNSAGPQRPCGFDSHPPHWTWVLRRVAGCARALPLGALSVGLLVAAERLPTFSVFGGFVLVPAPQRRFQAVFE